MWAHCHLEIGLLPAFCMTAAHCELDNLRCAGVSNAFLIATHHPLARTYNDISVLENRHLAALFNLLHEQPEVNILASLDSTQWKHVRKMIIDAVLHTDMTHHFPMVSKVSHASCLYAMVCLASHHHGATQQIR